MSKYNNLWEYVKSSGKKSLELSFDKINDIIRMSIDHSFLKYKNELKNYGYEVSKVFLKEKKVLFSSIQKSNSLILYIHGKGGNPKEAEHYKNIFKECDVVGLDYKAETPWEAESEFDKKFDKLSQEYRSVIVVANSIGAYFTMNALAKKHIKKAFFISPIVDMEKLITDMMHFAKISEEELCEKETIETSFGETLSWRYLQYVKNRKIAWNVPTCILYGENDNLTSIETISSFSKTINATLTVMNGGEHWFHTAKQMSFLDKWILENI